jgi:KEOPS complex subunit Cgi121
VKNNPEMSMQEKEYTILQFRAEIEESEEFLRNVREISLRYGVSVIFFDASMMAGIAHVRSSLFHALRAFREERTISNSLEMEALLYACGSRQCQHAVRFGIHTGSNEAYLCICPGRDDAVVELLKFGEICDENWEILEPEKMGRLREIFGITQEEVDMVGISRLAELVLERVALLEVYR